MSEPTKPAETDVHPVDTARAVDPNVDSSNESTPIGDAAQQAAAAEVAPTSPEELEEADAANSYKIDIKRALERETQDGKGDEDPGASDWVSFATEGVEKEDGQ